MCFLGLLNKLLGEGTVHRVDLNLLGGDHNCNRRLGGLLLMLLTDICLHFINATDQQKNYKSLQILIYNQSGSYDPPVYFNYQNSSEN